MGKDIFNEIFNMLKLNYIKLHMKLEKDNRLWRLLSSADNLANSLDPDLNVLPVLDPKLTLMVFLNTFCEQVDFERKSADY